MKKSAVGVGGLCVALMACGGFAACSSAPQPGAVEQVGEVVQPLQQTVETPSITGSVFTLAGSTRGSLDSATPTQGRFNDPAGVAVGPEGNVYVADFGNNSVRVIKASDGSLATFVPGRPNLLKNPGCEDLPPDPVVGIPHWLGGGTERPKVQCPGGTCGFAYDGTRYCWGGHGSVNTALSQKVSVVSDVQAGRKIHISGFQRASAWETTRFKVEYLKADDSLVSANSWWETPEVTTAGWTPFVDERLAPAGTVHVRLTLKGRATSGTDANSYFDNLVIRAVPNAGDATDAGLVGPKSIAVDPALAKIWIAANGIFSTSFAGGTVTKLAVAGYTPPPRANSISVTKAGYLVVADAVSPKLHVRTAGGIWYYANLPISGEVLSAVGGDDLGIGTFFWVAVRSSHQIKGFACPQTFTNGDTVTCTVGVAVPPSYPTPTLGSTTAGFADDFDGTLGQERFTFPTVLSVSGLTAGSTSRPDLPTSSSVPAQTRRTTTMPTAS